MSKFLILDINSQELAQTQTLIRSIFVAPFLFHLKSTQTQKIKMMILDLSTKGHDALARLVQRAQLVWQKRLQRYTRLIIILVYTLIIVIINYLNIYFTLWHRTYFQVIYHLILTGKKCDNTSHSHQHFVLYLQFSSGYLKNYSFNKWTSLQIQRSIPNFSHHL